MGTILESVNNLSEKLGVTEREQTIKDQLDLCVERLGGEGYSVDIAESANKFADKEDGTATFTTKTITENGTYAASDDGVSGYSSVTVNVPFTFNKIEAYSDTNGRVIIINVDSDEVTVNAMTDSGASFSRSIKKLIILGSAPKHTWIFAPTNDFDGIYKGENKLTFTGDTVVPGEGVYKATIDEMGGTRTIQTLFSGTIVPFEIL